MRVTSLENPSRSLTATVNDYGPAKRLNRVVDLSPELFRQLAPLRQGLVRVKVERIGE